MTKNHINIEKIDQQYLYDIIRFHPNISSGRKNYFTQYKRVLKNILLSKLYKKNIIPNKHYIEYKDSKFSIKMCYKS